MVAINATRPTGRARPTEEASSDDIDRASSPEPQRGATRSAPASGDAARLALVVVTRRAAVVITVVIVVASFVLSFSSLCDLASRSTWPARLAWLWPVIVDGTIVLCTMAIVALGGYHNQRGNRRFFWSYLVTAAAVSLSGNVVHALLPHGASLGPWLAAAIACVPPLALLASTHALQVLWRFNPTDLLAAEEYDQNSVAWAVATVIAEEDRSLASRPRDKVAEVIRLAYEVYPRLSNRGIGERVGLHHDVVGKIRDAAVGRLGEPVAAAG